MTLETDWTNPAFDSYADASEADAYLAGLEKVRDTAAWGALTTAEKEAVLRRVAIEMREYDYAGTIVTTITGDIAMWPRSGVYSPNGVEVADDVMPAFVKNYQSERALELADLPIVTQTSEDSIESMKLGTLSIAYQGGTGDNVIAAQAQPSWLLIDPYVTGSNEFIEIYRY